jgi:hypothetical protein
MVHAPTANKLLARVHRACGISITALAGAVMAGFARIDRTAFDFDL